MAKGLCPAFEPQAYREGHLTPVYFGSALNNFGVRELPRVPWCSRAVWSLRGHFPVRARPRRR
jgi:hypothetical protein